MIDRDHKLPLARQAKAVGISRGSIYYRPRSVGEAGLGLMRRIDELHLEYPFAGSRMMRGLLRQEGLSCGRRHIATLMRRMGIEALYRKPNTSRRRPGHTVYPYLLRGLEVSRPNQVWAMDITYIPMARGFVYLAAVMDWHSRKVLAWRVSVTMDTDFCVEALEELTCPPRTGPGVMLVLGLKERGVKMARRKHTAEQIINKLREAEVAISAGSTVAEVSRQIGVTQQTFYRWRTEYGGLKIDQARRLKQLETENGRLRRAVADLTLDNQILREAAKGNF